MLARLLRVIATAALPVVAGATAAQAACLPAGPDDPPQATLLTTAPGDEVFTAFGHTALRISGGGLPRPLVLDWGTWSSDQGNAFVLFVTGRLDYSLEAVPPSHLLGRARVQDRSVVAQRLALPPDAMDRLFADVDHELHQADRRFKYEPGLDNCSTRVRDLLDRATMGAIREQTRLPEGVTRRFEVLRHVGARERGAAGWLWWLVFELALTERSDTVIDGWDAMFIPQDMMRELRAIRLTWPDGSRRDLVADECRLRRGGHDFVSDRPPDRRGPLLAVGLSWAAVILAGASRRAWILGRAATVLLGRAATVLLGRAATVLLGRAATVLLGRAATALLGRAATVLLALVLGGIGTATTLLWVFGDLVGLGPNETWWVASPLSWSLLLTVGRSPGPRAAAIRRGVGLTLGALALTGVVRALLHLPDQEVLPVYGALVPPLLAAAAVAARPPPTSGGEPTGAATPQ